jgi:hypothetical protein
MTITSLRPALPPAARLRPGDLAGLDGIGLATRRLRAALREPRPPGLGIARGVPRT